MHAAPLAQTQPIEELLDRYRDLPWSANGEVPGRELRRRTHRPVIVTHGDRGMYLFELEGEQHIPAIPVAGPIDVVGAGDSAMAGLVAALCAGGTLAAMLYLFVLFNGVLDRWATPMIEAIKR